MVDSKLDYDDHHTKQIDRLVQCPDPASVNMSEVSDKKLLHVTLRCDPSVIIPGDRKHKEALAPPPAWAGKVRTTLTPGTRTK